MSIQAMAWAIEQQEVKEPVTRLVLLCLSNYAHADGSDAFPAIQRLARDTGLCERAVQYQLRKLIKSAVIMRGNQKIAESKISRADRRPVVYDILISRGARNAPRASTGCTPLPNGVHMDAERGAPHAPNPSGDPLLNLRSGRFTKTPEQSRRELRQIKAKLLGQPSEEWTAEEEAF